jgi:cell wall-associated NlpC family hydrolase
MTAHRLRHRTLISTLGILLAPGLCASNTLRAQNVEATIGRFYDSTGWTAYRLGVTRPLGGIFRVQLHGDLLRQVGGVGSIAGLGTDVTALRTGGQGPYLVAGLSGGLGSQTTNNLTELWGSWSAGVGYDLFPVSFLSVGAEGRWRQLSLGPRDGVELSIGLALHVGRGSSPPSRERGPTQPGALAAPEALPGAVSLARSQTLSDSIIATAAEAMGRPYSYGGTGDNGEGFDCSGLIQYSYAKHRITLPRRSTDQAREGKKIDRKLKLLAPADILTFSNRGGGVTHVGLYMGDGRFIHSATRGVQVSVLSAEDPYGRWWYKRWVGVRRIIER